MEADKGKQNIVREAGHFKRTAIMQGEIVSILTGVNDIQQTSVPNTSQLRVIAEGINSALGPVARSMVSVNQRLILDNVLVLILLNQWLKLTML